MPSASEKKCWFDGSRMSWTIAYGSLGYPFVSLSSAWTERSIWRTLLLEMIVGSSSILTRIVPYSSPRRKPTGASQNESPLQRLLFCNSWDLQGILYFELPPQGQAVVSPVPFTPINFRKWCTLFEKTAETSFCPAISRQRWAACG